MLPQALLVGRPVISYDVDGAREVVLPETGILLEPRDLDGLRQAILDLAADPGHAGRHGPRGAHAVRRPVPPRDHDPAAPLTLRASARASAQPGACSGLEAGGAGGCVPFAHHGDLKCLLLALGQDEAVDLVDGRDHQPEVVAHDLDLAGQSDREHRPAALEMGEKPSRSRVVAIGCPSA